MVIIIIIIETHQCYVGLYIYQGEWTGSLAIGDGLYVFRYSLVPPTYVCILYINIDKNITIYIKGN